MLIPEAMQILGLEIPFNPDDVKRAFRRKVLEHHPESVLGPVYQS